MDNDNNTIINTINELNSINNILMKAYENRNTKGFKLHPYITDAKIHISNIEKLVNDYLIPISKKDRHLLVMLHGNALSLLATFLYIESDD